MFYTFNLAVTMRLLVAKTRYYILIYFVLIPGIHDVFGQTQVRGTITDAVNGNSLAYASILVKGTYTGTAADAQGNYNLTIEQEGPVTLVFSYIGYRNYEESLIQTSSPVELNVALEVQPIGTNTAIVTAQIREQELQEVPVSVSIFDAKTYAKSVEINQPADLALYIPGFSGNQLAATQRLNIRGVGSNSYGVGLNSSIGFFIDETYGGGVVAPSPFLDVERIEVIKGPQNTLFGRNASAGVVHVITKKPVNRQELSLTLTGGNEGQREVAYSANYPLSSSLFVRVAGKVSNRDGVRRITNFENHPMSKQDLITNRLSMRFRPNGVWSSLLSLEHSFDDTGGQSLYSLNSNLGTTGNAFDRDIQLSRSSSATRKVFAGRFHIDRVLSSNMLLKSITGLRYYEINLDIDGDGAPAEILLVDGFQKATSFSQDLRLSGVTGKLNWLAAMGYVREDGNQAPAFLINDNFFVGGQAIEANQLGFDHPAFSVCDSMSEQLLGPCLLEAREQHINDVLYTSFSVYGDLAYAVSPQFNVSIGLRYTSDQKEFTARAPLGNGVTYVILGDNLSGPNTGDGMIENDDNWSGLQPRIAVDYSAAPGVLLYTSYARGYKSGGFNNITAIPFDEEISNAYEAGAKLNSKDGKYRLNLSAYFTNYQDLQVQNLLNAVVTVDNAAEVESKGIEIESTANLAGGFSLVANAALGQARYKNYVVGQNNFSDNVPDRSPDRSISIISQVNRPISRSANLVLRADYSYQTKVYFTRENDDELSQGGYGVFNAYIGLENLWNGVASIGVFGYNLSDSEYLVHAERGLPFSITTIRNVPRLFGLRLNVNLSNF